MSDFPRAAAVLPLRPWRGPRWLAVLALVPCSFRADPDLPRYVLCPNPGDNTQVPAEERVKVYAASVASGEEAPGRYNTPLTLRAAVLVEADWKVHLPKGTGTESTAAQGHSQHVSYAKCMNPGLANNTNVSCRLARNYHGLPVPSNSSWHPGRLRRYRNEEVAQDIAECRLIAREMRWIRGREPPRRLEVELRLSAPGQGSDSSLEAVVLLPLCLVRRPMLRASFCSQPLYGFHKLSAEMPWVLEDWLEYHLEHLGFEHAELYDVDGSFGAALAPWLLSSKSRTSTVSYNGNWPSSLSPVLKSISEKYPYCTEMFAYAHCMTTHRALSRYVALLHAPDEYIDIPQHRYRGSLPHILAQQETKDLWGYQLASLQVPGVSWGRGGPNSDEDAGKRGFVLKASMMRSNKAYPHLPLVNPEYCVCAGAHSCYEQVSDEEPSKVALQGQEEEEEERDDWTLPGPGAMFQLKPAVMVVQHYVEMSERNRGRCPSLSVPCSVKDSSMDWAVQMLRRTGEARPHS